MTERTLADEISAIAQYEVNQIPTNQICTITKNYNNLDFVDVKLLNGDSLEYVQCIGSTEIGDTALLVFTDGNTNNPLIINSAVTGEMDLRDYVKKADVNLKFNLEDNGQIRIGIDVGDGF